MYIGLYKTPNKALSCLVLSSEVRRAENLETPPPPHLSQGLDPKLDYVL